MRDISHSTPLPALRYCSNVVTWCYLVCAGVTEHPTHTPRSHDQPELTLIIVCPAQVTECHVLSSALSQECPLLLCAEQMSVTPATAGCPAHPPASVVGHLVGGD